MSDRRCAGSLPGSARVRAAGSETASTEAWPTRLKARPVKSLPRPLASGARTTGNGGPSWRRMKSISPLDGRCRASAGVPCWNVNSVARPSVQTDPTSTATAITTTGNSGTTGGTANVAGRPEATRRMTSTTPATAIPAISAVCAIAASSPSQATPSEAAARPAAIHHTRPGQVAASSTSSSASSSGQGSAPRSRPTWCGPISGASSAGSPGRQSTASAPAPIAPASVCVPRQAAITIGIASRPSRTARRPSITMSPSRITGWPPSSANPPGSRRVPAAPPVPRIAANQIAPRVTAETA